MAENYTKLVKLGSGAHGVVYRARVHDGKLKQQLNLPDVVALKKIRMRNSDEGISQETIRELKLLPELIHDHIIRVYHVFSHRSNITLCMEEMQTDLEVVINTTDLVLKPADIKAYMRMLLQGVEFCHRHYVINRDVKPANCLISDQGVLKLSDFGLAKIFGTPNRNMSPEACTLWFRAPELLFGSRQYGSAVDMWSVGCVFAQLMLRVPLFHGTTELEQLSMIFAAMGTPKEEEWPGMSALPGFTLFEERQATPLTNIFPGVSGSALDLLQSLLRFDPAKRISAGDALAHPYFIESPTETSCQDLPRPALIKSEQ